MKKENIGYLIVTIGYFPMFSKLHKSEKNIFSSFVSENGKVYEFFKK